MNDALLIVDGARRHRAIEPAARELLCWTARSLVFGQPLEKQRLERWP